MKLTFKKNFKKHRALLSKSLQHKVDTTIEIFVENQTDSRLNNHQLSGVLSHLRSLNVTGDYRIWIHQLDQKTYEIVEVIDVGTHSQLYG